MVPENDADLYIRALEVVLAGDFPESKYEYTFTSEDGRVVVWCAGVESMSESIPKCKDCKKPLKWSVLGQLSKYTQSVLDNPPPFGTPVAQSRYDDAVKEKARVEKYRAENKRGYLGQGDFCGQLCAASWAVSIMTVLRRGTFKLVKTQ